MKKALIILAVIIVHCTLYIDNCMSQWFSQPLPVNGQVLDLKFFDANTGLISLQGPINNLRTTNGGNNWYNAFTNQGMRGFEIIDSNTIYAIGNSSIYHGTIYRSYNRGASWDSVIVPNAGIVYCLSFVNKDTGWVGINFEATPVLLRTIDGGLSYTVQSTVTGRGKVFFLKYKVNGEYIGWSQDAPQMYKTTNSGNTWFQILDIASASQIYFMNENTGWAATTDNVRKTTNGGLNWTQYFLPTGFNLLGRELTNFKVLNKDTLYGDKGYRSFGMVDRGVIWKSINGGVNWGFQQPDTSIRRWRFYGIDFINKDTGWSDWIRTNNGGGPVIYPTYIDSNSTIIPSEYVLKQNYPNPFNPSTTIEFSLPKESYVKLKILDLSGKTVFWVVYDMLLYSGLHKFKIVDFEKLKLSSGVYFYQMEARDINTGQTNFIQSRKMILLK